MGMNQYTRKWERLETYGGKLVENIVQAASRDVLAHGLLGAEKAGYQVCLHVHDELITETPDKPDYTAEGLEQIMATNPPWSLGLPLAAAGYEAYRYRKD
jgi:DNA polymerase